RPGLAEGVDDAVQWPFDLPDLLDPELPHLGLAAVAEVELLDGGAGEVAPAALGEDRDAGLDVGAGLDGAAGRGVHAPALGSWPAPRDPAVVDAEQRRRVLGEDVVAALLVLP